MFSIVSLAMFEAYTYIKEHNIEFAFECSYHITAWIMVDSRITSAVSYFFNVSRYYMMGLINLASKERQRNIILQVEVLLQPSIGLLSTQGEWVDVASRFKLECY